MLLAATSAAVVVPVSLALPQRSFASSTIAQVGSPTTYSSTGTSAATTALPSGTAAGDVLVTFIETSGTTAVTCPSGWNVVTDVQNSVSHLVTCDTVVSAGQSAPRAGITPNSAVTMKTVAFSGVDTTDPVDATYTASSMTAPGVALSAPTTTAVYAAGWSTPTASNPAIYAPNGFTGLGGVNGGRSHLGVAKLTGTFSGSVPSGAFHASVTPRSPLSSTVALRPASSTTPPPATTPPTSPPPATTPPTTAPPATTPPTTAPPATTPPATTPPTTAPPATTPPTTTGGGGSSTPVWTSSDAQGTWNDPSGNGYSVNNDIWNGEGGPQTISVYSYNHWTVTSNQPQVSTDPGSVKSYPDTEWMVNKPINSIKTLQSSFDLSAPASGSGVQWDAAYDTWSGNWADELMVLTNYTGQPIPPAGSGAVTVTLGGIQYYAWHHSGYTAFAMVNPEVSGSVNLLPVFQYAVSQGWLGATETLGAVEYGVEISTTNGPQNFSLNNYSLTSN